MLDQDQGRWLTYAEAGQQLGISPEAVRQLARRRGWPRRTPNAYGGLATILVPDDAPVRPRPGVDGGYERGTPGQPVTGLIRPDNSSVRASEPPDMIRLIREIMEGLVTPLREQLDRERDRADRAELRAEELRAAGLRAQIDRRRSMGLLRRLRDALKGRA